MSYLITCSAKKNRPSKKRSSSIEEISFNNELGFFRKELIKLLELDLDWDYTLPACELYDGKVYRKIEKRNWENHSDKVKILSALFGWVSPQDLLPYYDLKMDEKITDSNKQIFKFWEEKKILQNFVDKDDIDLLSYTYRKAVNKGIKEVAKLPTVIFTDYGDKKGEWLNEQLSKI